MLSDEQEEEFLKVAEDAITAASHVRCSLSEFAEGLDLMRSEIVDRIAEVEDELKRGRGMGTGSDMSWIGKLYRLTGIRACCADPKHAHDNFQPVEKSQYAPGSGSEPVAYRGSTSIADNLTFSGTGAGTESGLSEGELGAIRRRNREHKRNLNANPYLRAYIDASLGPHWPTTTRQIEADIDRLVSEVARLRDLYRGRKP